MSSLQQLLVVALGASAFFAVPVLAAVPGERPGDAKMTCAEIGAEMEPAAKQMMAGMGDYAGALAPLQERATEKQAEFEQRSALAMACLPATIAGAAFTGAGNVCTGASDKAYELRDKAEAPKRKAEDKRILDGLGSSMAGAEATAATLDRPRIDRLMALAEAKQCN